MPKGIWWNPHVSERICSYITLPKFTWMLKSSVLSGKYPSKPLFTRVYVNFSGG